MSGTMGGWMAMRSYSSDRSVTSQRLTPGTTGRVVTYARPYRRQIIQFLIMVVAGALLVVATPPVSYTHLTLPTIYSV